LPLRSCRRLGLKMTQSPLPFHGIPPSGCNKAQAFPCSPRLYAVRSLHTCEQEQSIPGTPYWWSGKSHRRHVPLSPRWDRRGWWLW
jgi:hypothetical protein